MGDYYKNNNPLVMQHAPSPVQDDIEQGYANQVGPMMDQFTPDTPKGIRHRFIRKVYTIVCLQLCVTFIIASLFSLIDDWRIWMLKNWWMYIVGVCVGLAGAMALTCSPKLQRRHPINLILLSMMTVGMSFAVAAAAATVSIPAFLAATGGVAVIVACLTLFAWQTRWDFTGCGVYLLIAVIVLMIYGICVMIWPSYTTIMIYSCLGMAIVSIGLVVDTQLIVGGKNRKHELSVDDYIMGAVVLYLDIVNLWLLLIQILGAAERR